MRRILLGSANHYQFNQKVELLFKTREAGLFLVARFYHNDTGAPNENPIRLVISGYLFL